MSRSRKKNNIIKSGRYLKKIWWRIVRRNWKQEANNPDPTFKHPFELLNQYDHLDSIYICNGDYDTCSWCQKYGYKKCDRK